MSALPQLIEEDVRQLDDALSDLLRQTDATTALIIDKSGFLLTHHGDSRRFDLTTIAALASGAFMANQSIANLIRETDFNSVYQQGDKTSIFAVSIDENCLLLVIFAAKLSVGAIKYHAASVVQKIAEQMQSAQERYSDGFELAALDVSGTEDVFQKKQG